MAHATPPARPRGPTARVCARQTRAELREKLQALEVEAKDTFEDRVEEVRRE